MSLGGDALRPREPVAVRRFLFACLLALLLLPGCRSETAPKAGPALVVSDFAGNALLVLDPSGRNPVGAPIPMPGAPSGLAAGKGFVAVALLGRPYLEILRYPGLEELRRIYLGTGCSDVALDEPGSLLAAAAPESGEVLLVPPEGGSVRRVRVGGTPSAVAWHGRRLFVTNPGRNSLQWVDSVAGRLEGEAKVGLGPRGLAMAGDQALVALYDDNAVAVVNADRPKEVRRLPLAGGPLEVIPTGGGALVTLADQGQLAALDLRTGTSTCLPLGAGAAGMTLTPDGQLLFACCEQAGDLAVVTLHDNQVAERRALPRGARPRDVVMALP